jgi:hypothetical protein
MFLSGQRPKPDVENLIDEQAHAPLSAEADWTCAHATRPHLALRPSSSIEVLTPRPLAFTGDDAFLECWRPVRNSRLWEGTGVLDEPSYMVARSAHRNGTEALTVPLRSGYFSGTLAMTTPPQERFTDHKG